MSSLNQRMCCIVRVSDLSATRVNILAAWSIAPLILGTTVDARRVKYNVVSVSCSHVTEAAVYVNIKATHPSWSPAAIKSALMTTAYVTDPKKHENENEFAYGSGQVNPVKAVDTGLFFNASTADYTNFLCKQGYNTTTLRLIANDSTVCKSRKPGRAWDLNYPSFSLAVDGHKIKGDFVRTVTNVGTSNSTYEAVIDVPNFLKVKV